jgi:hypothetical protein
MSDAIFDNDERGFIFSDEDFGRRYFPQQKTGNPSRSANGQDKTNIARIHGGGNSFMRALRRRLAAAASRRSR